MAQKSYKGVIPGKTIDTSGTSGLDTAAQAHSLVTGEEVPHQGKSAPRTAAGVPGTTVDTTDTSVRNLGGKAEPVQAAAPEPEVEDSEPAAASEPEVESEDDRPAGNASEDEWREYRLAHGYTEDELEGKGRNDLRDLEDR